MPEEYLDPKSKLETLQVALDKAEARIQELEFKLQVASQDEEKFRYFFDHAPIGKSMTTPEGRLLRVNPALCAMLGYSQEELRELTWREISHPEDESLTIQGIQGLMSGEISILNLEKRYIARDGRTIWAHVTTRLQRDTEGNPQFFLTHVLDITERKREQEELKGYQNHLEDMVHERTSHLKEIQKELERKNSELEQFAYTLSHDLKTPLVTIQGFHRVLCQDLAAGRLEQMPNGLQRLGEAAQRMMAQLDDLLALSRMGRAIGELQEVHLPSLIQGVLKTLMMAMARTGAEIIVESGLPVVHGDPRRLSVVFQNLLENALKYVGSQPKPRVVIGFKKQAEAHLLFVEDNGMGIDPAHRERVFTVFHKLDPESAGSGIGLATVKRIVEAHGGKIWIETPESGQGTRFCWTLPFHPFSITSR